MVKKDNKKSDFEITLDYINDITKKVNLMQERIGKGCLIAFRAEDKDYGETKLTPSIFRNPNVSIKDLEANTKNILLDYGFVGKNASSIYYPIEAQHYGLKSRLIDISFNLLVSLYFVASNPHHLNEDGVIYVMGFPEFFSPNDTNIAQLYEKMLDENELIIEKNFKVLAHCRENERIKAQNGGFILFLGNHLHRIPDTYYEPVFVKKNDYGAILRSLKTLFGITEYNIYPEEDKMNTVPYDRKILYSNEFDSQISEYQNRVTFEVNHIPTQKERLRRIRVEIRYLNGLLEKYEHLDDKDSTKSNMIKKALNYLDFLRKKNGGK